MKRKLSDTWENNFNSKKAKFEDSVEISDLCELINNLKMASNSENLPVTFVNKQGQQTTVEKIIKELATIEQRDYCLNIMKAIEKKIEYLDREAMVEINENKGQKGKQIYVEVHTAMYELLKNNFEEEMKNEFGLEVIKDRVALSKTDFEKMNKAVIELQFHTNFVKDEKDH